MPHLGWKPRRADRDLWMMAETCPDDDMLYWAYILIYVDDILYVHRCPGILIAKLDEYFKMKEGSIQVPNFYLGAKLKKTVLPNGVIAWGVSSSKYVQSAVPNVHEYLESLPGNNKLMRKDDALFAGVYKPELDESPEFDPVMANFFQSYIGILHWCVELGRIGIITEVSMLSTYLYLTHEGHMDDVFHVFAYLVHNHNTRFMFNPTYPVNDMCAFVKNEWKSMYDDVKELLPSEAPVPPRWEEG
jgi:hypothetical protein